MESLNRGIMDFIHRSRKEWVFVLLMCNLIIVDNLPRLYAQQSSPLTKTDYDSLPNPEKAYMVIRGLEQDESKGYNPLHTLWNITSYLPKKIIHGIGYASGYSVRLINSQKFIDTVEDFLFTDDRSLGWYPLVDFTSSFRSRFGFNVVYRQRKGEALFRTNYAGKEKLLLEGILSYRLRKGKTVWRFTLSGLSSIDDDRKFFGIGPFPRTDERSHFLDDATNDYGVYVQTRRKIQLIIGFRPSTKWEYFLVSYFQNRHIQDQTKSKFPIGKNFDLKMLPGLQHPINQLYNEFSVRLDTRDRNAYISEGFRAEGYIGYSTGVGKDHSNVLRAGIDLYTTIPLFLQNRALIPRLVFDTISNLHDEIPIHFTEYPRQPSFRGVSNRRIFRTDNYSFVPSIEYQWPLTFNLSGHLFLDFLIVTNTLKEIHIHNTPWAAGFGIDFHGIASEVARVQCVYGSEGARILLSIGVDPLVSDRSNWK